jgi:hypothetical protein
MYKSVNGTKLNTLNLRFILVFYKCSELLSSFYVWQESCWMPRPQYLQRIKIFQTNWTLIFHSLIYLNKNIKEIHINKQIMLITYFILPSCVCYCYYLYILNNCDTKLIFHSSHMQEIDSSVYHISFQCKNLFLKTF